MTYLGEAFANFGIRGILFVPVMLGTLMAILSSELRRRRRNYAYLPLIAVVAISSKSIVYLGLLTPALYTGIPMLMACGVLFILHRVMRSASPVTELRRSKHAALVPRGRTKPLLTLRFASISGSRVSQLGSITVVVPVFRSAAILPELAEKLGRELPRLTDTFELILVNDGSPDDSWEVIQELERRYDWVRGICLMRNYGQHSALLCGIGAARHEYLVTMDDDLQHPPSELGAARAARRWRGCRLRNAREGA